VARPRQSSHPKLTPGQASYVLERLISDRRVSAGEVARYVSDMRREIDELQQRLESLRAASSGGERLAPPGRRGRPAGARGRRRGRPVTAERRASQQLQGRYLGLIRQIPKTKRAQYQKTAKEKGREAAIREMTSALGK
jgi:hypothetical protein